MKPSNESNKSDPKKMNLMCFASENVPISDSGTLDGYQGSWSEQDFGCIEVCTWASYKIAWQRKYKY